MINFVRPLLLLRSTAVAFQLAAGASTAGAQGDPNAQPRMWVTLGAGVHFVPLVDDGVTGSTWDFGQAYPLRGSLEVSIGDGFTAGVAGSYARVPLEYSTRTVGAPCRRCDAHATVATYGIVGHGGTGVSGFHTLYEIFLGVIQYDNFERDNPRTPLDPQQANRDFAFGVGLGFGYAFSVDWRVEVMFDQLSSVHERTNLPGNARTINRHYSTRLGARVGFF